MMSPHSSRRRSGTSLSLALLVLACALAAAAALPRHGSAAPSARSLARLGAGGATRAASGTAGSKRASYVGGPTVTASGATVDVRVSASFPDAVDRVHRWAEFFAALPHGPELSNVVITVVTGAELSSACRADALGCYRPGDLTFADEPLDGVSPEEVARHEYGHHVAENRINSPWPAVDWGPKRWATAVGVCADVKTGTAFPGDEGANYTSNPGEAWAEVYRILAERTAGLPANLWSIVVGRYFPDDAALAAAREDVINPWQSMTTHRYAGRFVKGGKRTWQRTLATPLDGNITVRLSMPVGPRHDVALYTADGHTLLGRWGAFTTRTRTISTTICGQRSVQVRVTRGTATGLFAVAVTAP